MWNTQKFNFRCLKLKKMNDIKESESNKKEYYEKRKELDNMHKTVTFQVTIKERQERQAPLKKYF